MLAGSHSSNSPSAGQHVAQHRLGHAGAGPGRHRVDGDAVLPELAAQGDGHGRDAGLGRRVVGLAGQAVEPRLADAVLMMRPATSASPALDRSRQWMPAKWARGEVALEVDADHVVPLGLGHREAHGVAQDPGVVDQDVEVPEPVRRSTATEPTTASAPAQVDTSSVLAAAVPPAAAISSTTAAGRVAVDVVDRDRRAPRRPAAGPRRGRCPRPAPVTMAVLAVQGPQSASSTTRLSL